MQGIDNKCLNKPEGLKKKILKNIGADKLAQLYFDTFNKEEIKYGDGIFNKNHKRKI